MRINEPRQQVSSRALAGLANRRNPPSFNDDLRGMRASSQNINQVRNDSKASRHILIWDFGLRIRRRQTHVPTLTALSNPQSAIRNPQLNKHSSSSTLRAPKAPPAFDFNDFTNFS